MNKLIYIAVLITLLSSCDNGEDMFKENDNTPDLTIRGDNHTSYGRYTQDSLKFEDIYYSLHYLIEDEEDLEINIKVDSIFLFEIEKHKVVFGAQKVGSSNIYITVTDSWDKKDEITFNLTCFENLEPVADFEVEPLSGDREFRIDGSKSYDRDAKYGGNIVLYRFFVLGKQIDKMYHSAINYVFPSSGQFKVGLQVQDNNGDWSSLVQATISIP